MGSIAVFVALVFEIYRFFLVVLAEEVGRVVLVAGGYELFQAEVLEVIGKIVKEEVAYARVVAVAEDRFAFEMFRVVLEFVFNIGELRVELVLFRVLCFYQVFV